ncbi:hypothetical protein DPMN_083047 [Dreissena polymorpha]|uniref:Uncharacterized protein n=1 Tax=Dreissena polymorpha TaxID=45954 RepID=A0A9D4BHC3_DREPO|nr:hypothetical protein DPMN_083047 [Dreissena polymorpha]
MTAICQIWEQKSGRRSGPSLWSNPYQKEQLLLCENSRIISLISNQNVMLSIILNQLKSKV